MATTIETDRLVLRPLCPDDLEPLVRLHAERSFWEFPLGRGQTRAETEAFLERVLDDYLNTDVGLEAVVERDTGVLAGWAGLSIPSFLPEILPAVEVGWRLGSNFRGRGCATEAGAAWVQWGFGALGLEKIVSVYEPANVASGRVMEKLGFNLERVTPVPSTGVTVHVTSLTAERWRTLKDESPRSEHG